MAALGIFIIFTTTAPMVGTGGNIIPDIDEGLPIGIGKQAGVLGSLSSGRCKAETNFADMEIVVFGGNQRNLFNDREWLTIILTPGREDKISNSVLNETTSEGNSVHVNASGTLPSGRCKAETNFADMEIVVFGGNQRNLFNDKELLAITLAPGKARKVSDSVLKGTQNEENLARENDFSQGTGQILSAGLGMGKERVSQVIGASLAAEFRGEGSREVVLVLVLVAVAVPMVAHVVSGVRVVAVVAPMVGAAKVLVGAAVVRMVMPVLSLAAEDEAGKNFNEDAKT